MLLRRALCPLTLTTLKSFTLTMNSPKLKKQSTVILSVLIYGLREMVWRGTVQNTRRWCWEKNKGTDEPVFKCEESQLPISNTMELLGVTIDEKLNFEKHIAKICRKVSQQIAVLKRIQKLLPFETRRDLYKAFILSHFNYCSETWHFCNKKSADKLEMLNKRAFRCVFSDKSSPYA